jgi:uncharacterized protein YndB with AHSA1/START domain
MNEQQRQYILELEHEYEVPPDVLFRAWTDAFEFMRWADLKWCEIDLRPGGAYLISHPTSDGSDDITRGRYIEVIANERLKFTWNGSSPDGPTGETVVLLEFARTDAGSRLRLRHEFIYDYSMRDCEWGWNDWLDTLARHFKGSEEAA